MQLSPLDGFVVGVTADRRSSEQCDLLERRGARVIRGPTISTEYLSADSDLRAVTVELIRRPADYLVATTGIGVRAWFEAAQSWGLSEDLGAACAATRIAARGPKAASAIRAVGLDVWATSETERLDDTLAALYTEDLAGAVVAFQQYGETNDGAVAELATRGATVVELPVYRWRLPADDRAANRLIDAACAGHVDAITFTSAPAVDNLFAIAARSDRRADLLAGFNTGGVVAACIGPVCAEEAVRAGVVEPVAPARGRLGLLVRALSDALQARRLTLPVGTTDVTIQGAAVAVDGVVVHLSPRERAVLELLVSRRGSVVSKQTLVRAVWNDTVESHALDTTISRLRRHLGPAGAVVRSVRGRGYWIDTDPSGSR